MEKMSGLIQSLPKPHPVIPVNPVQKSKHLGFGHKQLPERSLAGSQAPALDVIHKC